MLQWKPKGKKGFSLIELLVVVGIIGILSAIAIPAYNRYRSNAARGAFDATGANMARAFQACVASDTFTTCTTGSGASIISTALRIVCPSKGNCNSGAKAPNFCVDMDADIGGTDFAGCIQVNAQTGALGRTFNQKVCYDDAVASCDHDNDPATPDAADTANSYQGADCETIQSPLKLCTTNAECGNSDVVCANAQDGLCDTTDGTCS